MNKEKYFEVYIKEPNHTLHIHKKELKTPLKTVVSSKQLKLIKLMLTNEGISKYSITEINSPHIDIKKVNQTFIEDIEIEDHIVVVEEL